MAYEEPSLSHGWKEQSILFLKTRSSPSRVVFFMVLLLLVTHLFFLKAPRSFPVETMIIIEEGTNLSQVSELLKEKSVIKSAAFFKWFVRLSRGDGSIVSGDYIFASPGTVFSVARKLTRGDYGLKPVEITIPEGTSVRDMGVLLEAVFPEFKKEVFDFYTRGEEGYLFPDTYRFFPNVKAEQVYREIRANFDKRIEEVSEVIRQSGKTLRDIIIMASLLEEEARTDETRRIIAGILWERLRIGMALQVDAPFVYIIGKGTAELSLDDLEIDNPYNTYKYAGLPPGPITNPGLGSIRAALYPIETSYLYFLSDREGVMHYAETHEEHLRNKERYLP